MDWINKPLDWKNAGTPPSPELVESGFFGGYSPAAETLNFAVSNNSKVMNEVYTSVDEIESIIDERGTELEAEIMNKIDAEIGKGLTSNDFTDYYKQKLDVIKTDLAPNLFLSGDGTYKELDIAGGGAVNKTSTKIVTIGVSNGIGYTADDVDYYLQPTDDIAPIINGILAEKGDNTTILIFNGAYVILTPIVINKPNATICGQGKETTKINVGFTTTDLETFCIKCATNDLKITNIWLHNPLERELTGVFLTSSSISAKIQDSKVTNFVRCFYLNNSDVDVLRCNLDCRVPNIELMGYSGAVLVEGRTKLQVTYSTIASNREGVMALSPSGDFCFKYNIVNTRNDFYECLEDTSPLFGEQFCMQVESNIIVCDGDGISLWADFSELKTVTIRIINNKITSESYGKPVFFVFLKKTSKPNIAKITVCVTDNYMQSKDRLAIGGGSYDIGMDNVVFVNNVVKKFSSNSERFKFSCAKNIIIANNLMDGYGIGINNSAWVVVRGNLLSSNTEVTDGALYIVTTKCTLVSDNQIISELGDNGVAVQVENNAKYAVVTNNQLCGTVNNYSSTSTVRNNYSIPLIPTM